MVDIKKVKPNGDHKSGKYAPRNPDKYIGASYKEETISQKPFTPNNKVFFGDYLGIASVNGHIRPIWPRMDEGKITLWTAIIDQKNEPKQK